MPYGLYEYELEELLDELKASLAADHDDYIFAVTENSGHVAMVLIEKAGHVYSNEARNEHSCHSRQSSVSPFLAVPLTSVLSTQFFIL